MEKFAPLDRDDDIIFYMGSPEEYEDDKEDYVEYETHEDDNDCIIS